MTPLAPALCATLALGSAALAQTDIATQFSAAREVFLPGGIGAAGHREAVRATLTALQGRWQPVSLIADSGRDIDTAVMDEFCGSPAGFTFAAPTPYRVTLSRGQGDRALTETYDYIAGLQF